jgi:formylglycine-generating enzyme required for sulfatase activity
LRLCQVSHVPDPLPLKYRAFISYSHQDTAWAKWLQRGLESFKIDKDLAGRETARGAIPETLRPIFRDRDDFTAGKALAEQTLAALDAAEALIVICSPAAATSRYVNEEIRAFKSLHPDRPVIPLIVAGKPGDPTSECFPQALKFKLDAKGRITKKSVELLAADAREEGDGKNLALAKVVAGLIGVSSDEIFRRADRERRAADRRRRRVQTLFGILAFVILAGAIGWMNQDYLMERWRWFGTIRPYMLTKVRPYVLTAEAERALKPQGTFRECAKDCPEMVVVPTGKFQMGSPEDQGTADEHPQHEVTFAKPFAVSKFEVTFDDWDACVAYGDCDPRTSDNGWGRGRQPVIYVNWDQANRYVAWLSSMTGKPYRLLSEAEWEYAARAGTQTAYPWGEEIGTGKASCDGCGSRWDRRQTAPVGSFAANAFGLYDMNGNVWEWVEDCVHNNYNGAPGDGLAWTAGSDDDCNSRIVRSGSWNSLPRFLRSAARVGSSTGNRNNSIGFRVARTLNR